MEVDEAIVTTESVEQREKDRLSMVATIGILIATVAATVAGSLAALSGFHAGDADAHRVAWATYSNELLLSYNQYAADQRQSADARLEEAWRSHFLIELAAQAYDPAIAATLRSEASAANGLPEAPTASRPQVSSPDPASGAGGWAVVRLRLRGGERLLRDVAQRQPAGAAYIAAVSMLAIGLFLFALSKTLSQASMEKLFLALGALITLIVGR